MKRLSEHSGGRKVQIDKPFADCIFRAGGIAIPMDRNAAPGHLSSSQGLQHQQHGVSTGSIWDYNRPTRSQDCSNLIGRIH